MEAVTMNSKFIFPKVDDHGKHLNLNLFINWEIEVQTLYRLGASVQVEDVLTKCRVGITAIQDRIRQ